MFGKLSHGSLPADTVASVFGSVDGHRGSVSGHGAQTSKVQGFDIWFISPFKKIKKETVKCNKDVTKCLHNDTVSLNH